MNLLWKNLLHTVISNVRYTACSCANAWSELCLYVSFAVKWTFGRDLRWCICLSMHKMAVIFFVMSQEFRVLRQDFVLWSKILFHSNQKFLAVPMGFFQQHSCPWTKCMLRLYLTETACCLLLPWSVKSTDERLLLMWYTQGKGAYMNAAWSRQQEIDAWRWTYCSKGRRVLDVCIKCRRL